MSARTTIHMVRRAPHGFCQVRHASIARILEPTKASAPSKPTPKKKKRTPKPEHGRQIYIFEHLQRHHIVYSLTRAMNNNIALSQIPFVGKKTVPRALRKDLWHPFALINFAPGSGSVGLSVYSKLREFRKRHEHEWELKEVHERVNKFFASRTQEELDSWKKKRYKQWSVFEMERQKLLMNQKANSVADIADVLSRLARPEGAEVEDAEEDAAKFDMGVERPLALKELWVAANRPRAGDNSNINDLQLSTSRGRFTPGEAQAHREAYEAATPEGRAVMDAARAARREHMRKFKEHIKGWEPKALSEPRTPEETAGLTPDEAAFKAQIQNSKCLAEKEIDQYGFSRSKFWSLYVAVQKDSKTPMQTEAEVEASKAAYENASPEEKAMLKAAYFRRRRQFSMIQANVKAHRMFSKAANVSEEEALRIMKRRQALQSAREARARGEVTEPSIGLTGENSGEQVEVLWWNLEDAQFAKTWSDNVEHSILDTKTNNRRSSGMAHRPLVAKEDVSKPAEAQEMVTL